MDLEEPSESLLDLTDGEKEDESTKGETPMEVTAAAAAGDAWFDAEDGGGKVAVDGGGKVAEGKDDGGKTAGKPGDAEGSEDEWREATGPKRKKRSDMTAEERAEDNERKKVHYT